VQKEPNMCAILELFATNPFQKNYPPKICYLELFEWSEYSFLISSPNTPLCHDIICLQKRIEGETVRNAKFHKGFEVRCHSMRIKMMITRHKTYEERWVEFHAWGSDDTTWIQLPRLLFWDYNITPVGSNLFHLHACSKSCAVIASVPLLAARLFRWLLVLICSERKVLLAKVLLAKVLLTGGWWLVVLKEKYRWLVADKPDERDNYKWLQRQRSTCHFWLGWILLSGAAHEATVRLLYSDRCRKTKI
jgi:hypothetical protein